MAKSYIYAEIDITDPAEYEKYRAVAWKTVAEFGGRYAVRGGDPEVLEGDRPVRRVVLLEFPSRERAVEWYNSEQYRAPKSLRHRSATTNLLVLSGAED